MKKSLLLLAAIAATASLAFAQVDPAVLAAETEALAVSTAKDPLTPELIVSKVNEAAAMIAKEGLAGISKLQGKDSPYVFSGTYIWVHDGDNVMVMHPIKYKMNGKSLSAYADDSGKPFFVEMTNLVKAKGDGWVDYTWPKPGEKAASLKVSYLKGVTVDGKLLILGCGVYGFTPEQIETLKKSN